MADAGPVPGDKTQGALSWLRRAHIVNSETQYSFLPFPDEPENELHDYLAGIDPAAEEIHALDLLQHTRTTDLDASVLRILLAALVDALPQAIRDIVGLRIDTTGKDPPLDANNKAYVFWVIPNWPPQARNHALVVLRYEASDSSKPDVLDHITHWGIVDPLQTEERPNMAILTETAGVRAIRSLRAQGIASASEYQIWAPPFREAEQMFAAGFAVYSATAQLLDRLGTLHFGGGGFDADLFFAPMRRWLNPDALRAEMLGHAAIKAMGKLQWKARLALYPVKPSSSVDGQAVDVEELAPRKTPPIAYQLQSDLDSLFGEDGASITEDSPTKIEQIVQEDIAIETEQIAQEDVITQVGYIPGITRLAPRQPTDVDSIFGSEEALAIHEGGDAAEQTETILQRPEPIIHDDKEPYRESARPPPQGRPSSPPGHAPRRRSSSSSTGSSITFSTTSNTYEDDGLPEIYLARKQEELDRVTAEERRADEACEKALVFARRVQSEVLDAMSGGGMPTAYAVERLFWLVRRATDLSRSVDNLVALTAVRYSSAPIHSSVVTRLAIGLRCQGFRMASEQRRAVYEEADGVLSKAYAARVDGGCGSADADQLLAEKEKEKEEKEEEIHGDADGYSAGSKTAQKKSTKRGPPPYETTSTTDADGEPVYTMHISKRQRTTRPTIKTKVKK